MLTAPPEQKVEKSVFGAGNIAPTTRYLQLISSAGADLLFFGIWGNAGEPVNTAFMTGFIAKFDPVTPQDQIAA
jgi:hypothetical protein